MGLTQVSEKGIKDGEILNADINASAAIAKSKIETFVNTNSNNRVITGSNTTNALEGEANLTYNGQLLQAANSHINIDSGYSYQWGDSHERIEQSDGKIEFFTNNGEQMTLSGSNLGIGTTSPSNSLELASSGHTGLLIQSDRTTASDNIGALDFRSSSTDVARIQSLVDGTLKFRNTSSLTERMRIDDYGVVRVGNTHDQGTSGNTKRIALGAKASIWGWASGQINGALTLADNYYWTGTQNIAVENDYSAYLSLRSGSMRFGTTSSTHAAGANISGGIHEKVRFQQGGGISFNGDSATANALDDYEEGTFTPGMEFGGGSTNMSLGSMAGIYTKIGIMVFATLRFYMAGKGDDTGHLTFTGLPYAVGDVLDTTSVQGGFDIQYLQGNCNRHEIKAYPWEGTSVLKVYARSNQNSSTSFFTDSDITGTFDGRISFFYTTA